MSTAERYIWLCADDYGISPSVNAGIRALIERGRLNATSVMVSAPHLGTDEVLALKALNVGGKRAALGLHVTLTAPFKPLTTGFAPLRHGRFLPVGDVLRTAMARRLNPDALLSEIASQLRAFFITFGRPPDFLDGHQHVHLFPQVRDAFLKAAAQAAPRAWVRQCGRARVMRRLHERKALVLDMLSVRFRSKARRLGIATNPAFAGSYAFTRKANFAKIFPRFLAGLPDGGLIMCHPGIVDDELKRLDTLTTLREHELAYFNSDEFPKLLAHNRVALARPAGEDDD
jgi:predicted glycoside hydrolase/deacetylase ChbG (UPF0249 family)